MKLIKIFSGIQNSIYQKYNEIRFELNFPLLKNYGDKSQKVLKELSPIHHQYIENISTGSMAVSLETATFIKVYCQTYNPKRVLDLGSGFSSYVLRSTKTANPDIEYWSVDDNSEWLIKTKNFLTAHNISPERLYQWDEFKQLNLPKFDFIFHDMGNMKTRIETLDYVTKLINSNDGIILLDDFHKKEYHAITTNQSKKNSWKLINLDFITTDKYNRYSIILRQSTKCVFRMSYFTRN